MFLILITLSTCNFMSACLNEAVSEGEFYSRSITFSFFFSLAAGSLMTTKHAQPQSTFAKSLTSTSTNTPYFKAAGTIIFCGLFPRCLEFNSKVRELCLSTESTYRVLKDTRIYMPHYELLFNDLKN